MLIHILVFSRPEKLGKSTKENLRLLEQSAVKMGHETKVIFDHDCQLKFEKKPEVLIKNHQLKKINVIIVRANPPGRRMEFKSAVIRQFESMGIPVVNDGLAVMRAKNKLRTIQILSKKNIPMPKTYAVFHSQYIDDVIADLNSFPVIIKSVSGSHGLGVSIIESRRGLKSIIEMITKDDASEPIIIQEYVKESKGKDVRVFIVGKKIVGVMERVAARRSEFRSNFHLGGKVRLTELSIKERNIALAAAEACGLEVAGVDIIRSKTGPKVLEVNANPGLEGITQATGKDIAGEIIKYAVKKAKRFKKMNLEKTGEEKTVKI